MKGDDSIFANEFLRNSWRVWLERPTTKADIEAGLQGSKQARALICEGDDEDQARMYAIVNYPDWTVTSVKNEEVIAGESLARMIADIMRD